MEFFSISGLINALTAISFGVLVFLKNRKDRSSQIFFLMTVTLAVWGIAYWRWLTTTDEETAIFWLRILAVGSIFIPTFFFDWVSVFLKRRIVTRLFVVLAYLTAILTAFFAGTDKIIASVEPKLFFPFWPNPGLFYSFYLVVLYLGVVLFTLFALYNALKMEEDPQRRGQLLYILLGAVLGFGGGFTNFFLWYDIAVPPYGNFLVAAFPFLLGFSIIKHGLFNVKAIATEILVFFIGIILLIQFVLSDSLIEYILRGFFFVVVVLFGVLLIKSVYKEVEQRERIEKLAGELERANRSLEAANERLKELDQLKSEFVSLATHQIRGPLTAIKGYASMMLEGDYGALAGDARKTTEIIFKSSSSLADIVEDFLNVSRIEQGKMKYEFSDFDLSELAADAARELEPGVKEKGLELAQEIEPGITVRADKGKIKQVIGNLIDNAIKYTPKGKIQVKVAAGSPGAAVRIEVSDTGAGIAEETLPHLFKKFSRASDASKWNIKGTGLGLYIASELIKAHRGRIWAESEGEGKGSTFILELPRKTD